MDVSTLLQSDTLEALSLTLATHAKFLCPGHRFERGHAESEAGPPRIVARLGHAVPFLPVGRRTPFCWRADANAGIHQAALVLGCGSGCVASTSSRKKLS